MGVRPIVATEDIRWRNAMARLLIAAAALLSAIATVEVYAQSFSEPAAFAAQHPDRDVLNGGALTPAARASAGLDGLKRAPSGSSTSFVAPGANAIPSVSGHKRSRHRPK
jgi:hypothetical protein